MPYIPYHDYVPVTLGSLTLKNIIHSEMLDGSSELSTSWKYVQQSTELAAKLESNPEEVLGVAKLFKELLSQHFKLKVFITFSKQRTMA